MKNSSAANTYQLLLQTHNNSLAQLQRLKNQLGLARLVAVVATIGLGFFGFQSSIVLGVAGLVVGIACFLFLIAKDLKNNKKITQVNILININKEELAILQNNYGNRITGQGFASALHGYANDLDIFGQGSLFQYINRCQTQQGQRLLATNLLSAISITHINNRQQAVKELSQQTEWQQSFQAIGQQSALTIATQEKISDWLKNEEEHYQQPYWKFVLPCFGFVTILAIVLNIFDVIGNYQLTVFLFCCFSFAFNQSKTIKKTNQALSKIVGEVAVLEEYISLMENSGFKPGYLGTLQQKLIVNNTKASQQISSLKEILQRFDVRLNVFLFIALNTLFLWDIWQIRALNSWKNNNRAQVNHWFEVIAEMEAINSLAVLSFNNDSWCFPEVTERYFEIKASAIGHPLIDKNKCIPNSFAMDGMGKVSLITGSNMAGKSTFLRSLGCNTVLALMGSTVCAESFTVSHVKLLSSMRIADNLAENTSTFYAELKKLKGIIEAVKRKEKVFILLDEILRGTNSLDRHTGSKALIKQFIAQQTVAILATHDVALAEEINNYPQAIHNYHFDVQVEKDELYFDYKLKTGVCTSLNASILMRKIGIEMD